MERTSGTVLRVVLFDLDGTLADTAPDLGYALNRLRAARALPELPLSHLRTLASSGARGLLEAGFGITPQDANYEAMRDEFLDVYERNLSRSSRLFPGVPALLDRIEGKGLAWGIVTNKAKRFSIPLVQALGLLDRAACLVCGDTTPHAKPHPAPMLEAMTLTQSIPAQCVYVGDDERDVQAGHAAGVKVAVVRYGYLGNGRPPEQWGADWIVDSAAELDTLLLGAVE